MAPWRPRFPPNCFPKFTWATDGLLKKLVTACWNCCHDLVIPMLFLPCAFLLSALYQPFILPIVLAFQFSWAGLTFVLPLCEAHHIDISTTEQRHKLTKGLAWVFVPNCKNKGAKWSLLTVWPHTLLTALKSQTLVKSVILLLPLEKTHIQLSLLGSLQSWHWCWSLHYLGSFSLQF